MTTISIDRGKILIVPKDNQRTKVLSRSKQIFFWFMGVAIIFSGFFLVFGSYIGLLEAPGPLIYGINAIILLGAVFVIFSGLFLVFINGMEVDAVWENGLTTTIYFPDKLRRRAFLKFSDIDKVYWGVLRERRTEYYGNYGEKVRENFVSKRYLVIVSKSRNGTFWSKLPHYVGDEHDEFYRNVLRVIKEKSGAVWIEKNFEDIDEMKRFFSNSRNF